MGTFFDSGSAGVSREGGDLLKLLAQELGKLPDHVAMEGHTDTKPCPPTAAYGNWELSADRANAARRLMQISGLQSGQITQVRGFADRRLRKPDAPLDASNRRISVIVQYLNESPETASGDASTTSDAKHEETSSGANAAEEKLAGHSVRQDTLSSSTRRSSHPCNPFVIRYLMQAILRKRVCLLAPSKDVWGSFA